MTWRFDLDTFWICFYGPFVSCFVGSLWWFWIHGIHPWCTKNPNISSVISSRPRTSSILWLPTVPIPWLRLPSIWVPHLQLKEMLAANTLGFVFFSESWRNFMVLSSFFRLPPTKIHAHLGCDGNVLSMRNFRKSYNMEDSNLDESCFFIQDVCVFPLTYCLIF